jgi:hypothetical protein
MKKKRKKNFLSENETIYSYALACFTKYMNENIYKLNLDLKKKKNRNKNSF